jgi:alkylation response protein AidB-like acyl-CoA dehydrogenase
MVMDYKFSEEQEMLRASAHDFLEKECTESVLKELEEKGLGHSMNLWKKIAGLGWLGLVYPEKYGGFAMNFVDLAVLYEEFGRALFPSPYLSTVILCGLTILEAGNEAIKSEMLPSIIEGNEIIALTMSEPGSSLEGISWSPEDVTIVASVDGDDYLLIGVNLFVYDADIASKLLVPAKTKAGGYSEDGITLFLVDSESPGISVGRLATPAGNDQCEVIFNRVRVNRESIIGELNVGWAPLSHSMQVGAVMMSAQMLGAGQRLLQLSEEDYITRSQSGIPSEVDQYNKEFLNHLKQDVEGCRQAIYKAAEKLAEGKPDDFTKILTIGWNSYTS